MKRVYITLDCDYGETPDTKNIPITDSIKSCIRLFEDLEIEKNVTWFVNEQEVKFTEKYPDLLARMAEGEIALHVHLNRPPISQKYLLPSDKNVIREYILRNKTKLEKWLTNNTDTQNITSFRSGNLLTNKQLFEVLEQLNFKIDSSIPSQFDFSLREVGRKIILKLPTFIRKKVYEFSGGVAYHTLSLGKKPFFIGKILEMPIHLYIGGRYANNKEWVLNRAIFQLSRVDDFVIYWHPYEIVRFGADIYREILDFIMENYNVEFLRMSQTKLN